VRHPPEPPARLHRERLSRAQKRGPIDNEGRAPQASRHRAALRNGVSAPRSSSSDRLAGEDPTRHQLSLRAAVLCRLARIPANSAIARDCEPFHPHFPIELDACSRLVRQRDGTWKSRYPECDELDAATELNRDGPALDEVGHIVVTEYGACTEDRRERSRNPPWLPPVPEQQRALMR